MNMRQGEKVAFPKRLAIPWRYGLAGWDGTRKPERFLRTWHRRCFEYPVIIRAVNTKDAMTATVEDIPFSLLSHITERILSEVKGVNRVCYDMTPKPVGTIEWE